MFKWPVCGTSRYKLKDDEESNYDEKSQRGPLAKGLWYLPIIPRFKRFFSNPADPKDLTWHVNGRIYDGMVLHPADCSQWKKIDHLFLDFGKRQEILGLD